jgi:UDP-N-acetylenolpyruvoylglucosamine reductase
VSTPASVRADYPTSRLTTVGTGGPARWFARPERAEELSPILAWARGQGLPLAVVGLGSNLLVADAGYDGLVLRLAGELARVEQDGERIVCGGGAALAVVVRRSQEWALAGVEFACAIPGTAGGAVRMNAGAYGSEMSDVLAQARVIGSGGERTGGPADLGMRYRRSNVAADEVVAEAVLRLAPGEPEQIRQRVRDFQGRRREAQPAKVRTFGSVWKNPEGDLSAGRILERCGLKGYRIGGARISPVHANFIENTGDATSADVVALMAEARRRALDEFGVTLEHEVQMLGDLALPPLVR